MIFSARFKKDPSCQKGFTLMELLAVVMIIAVLSVITYSLYRNLQKKARDSRREVEIDIIAKSLESSFDARAGRYSYGVTEYANDFVTSVPLDPLGYKYCLKYYPSSLDLIPNPDPWVPSLTDSCPSGWQAFDNLIDMTDLDASQSWKVCAMLEVDNTPFCKASMVR